MTLTPTARNAMRLLADRSRLPHLRAIGRAYHALREERGGLVLAEVTTASALPDAYFAELERTLGQVTGRKVRLVKRVDPSLIAGVVTKVGDKVFDGSMKNRLSELRASLSDATLPAQVPDFPFPRSTSTRRPTRATRSRGPRCSSAPKRSRTSSRSRSPPTTRPSR
jgi:hypothetical protein